MIRFAEFTKHYGDHTAVEALTFGVEPGEAVALLGPNGSGKTTTLKGAAGLVRPTSGRVFVGEPEQDASGPPARRAISYLPQRVSFPEALTGHEVVEFYRRLRGGDSARSGEVLRLASLNGASSRPISTYSGGMIQRLGLAVAALPDAPVMLLDEPTAALDPEGLCAFYGLVERRRREGTHPALHLAPARRRRAPGRSVPPLDRRTPGGFALARAAVRAARLARRPASLAGRGGPGTASRACERVAPAAVWAGEELVVPGPASDRPRVLDIVRAAGGRIVNLVAEEARLDSLYREMVRRGSEDAGEASDGEIGA